MLILSRKKNESIIIDGNIEVQIIAMDDGKVKIGVSAPKTVSIHRKEVYEKIQSENKKAVLRDTHVQDLKKFIQKKG